MAEQAYAYVTLIPVAKGFKAGVAKELGGVDGVGKDVGEKTGKNFSAGFGTALKAAGLLAATAAAVGAVASVKFFGNAVKEASDLGESVNAVNKAYGDFAGDVLKLGDGVASRLGLSTVDFNAAAVRFSAFAGKIAEGGGTVAGAVDALATRAADFASVFNIEVSEALQVFQSGLSGEAEPLKRFGINMLESEVNAFAMANGIGEVGRQLTETEKVQARYGLLMQETDKTAGDFADTSDQLANSQRIIAAEFKDMSAEIGTELIPAVTDIVDIFATNFMPIFKDLAETTAPLVRTVLEGVADIMREATDPTTFFGGAVTTLKESFDTLIEVMTPTQDGVESTMDVLGSLANLLSVLMDIISSFTAFIGTIGPAFEALQKGDFQTFFSWLLSDPVEWRRLNVTTTYTQIGFPPVDVSGISDSFSRQARTGFTKSEGGGGGGGGGGGPTIAEIREQVRALVSGAREAAKEARKDFNEAVAKAREDHKKALAKIGEDYNQAVAAANDAYLKRTEDITKRYNKAVEQATKRRDMALAKALEQYDKAVADINADFAKRQADIIQQSMDRLRNAFRSAVQTNVASIFDSNEIAGSIDGTIEMMRKKLADSRQLMANAAALSAAGFSQTFIEQIVGAGTDVGNEMATAILNSTPQQQAEMRELFNTIEKTANSGMDDLAQSLFEKNGLATQELKDLYAETELQLAESLLRQKEMYDLEVVRIQTEFTESIAEAQATMQEAMAEAQIALDEALLAAEMRRQDAILKADERLREALVKANERFLKDLEKIEKTFNDKIASMKGRVGGLAAEIANLQSALSGLQAATTKRVETLKLTPMAEGGLVTGPTPALVGEAGPEVVIPLDRFESMLNRQSGPGVNYYAAPNQSLDSEQALFDAMRRAKVVVGW